MGISASLFIAINKQLGVRALEMIPTGQIIAEYTGELISCKEANSRLAVYLQDPAYAVRYLYGNMCPCDDVPM